MSTPPPLPTPAASQSPRGAAHLLAAGLGHPPAPIRWNALDGMFAAVEEIERRWPGFKAPNEQDRQALAEEFLHRIESGDWMNCRLSKVGEAVRAVFDENRLNQTTIEPVRQFFYRELSISNKSALLRAGFSAYMETFSPSSGHSQHLADALAQATARLPQREGQILEFLPTFFQPKRIVDDIANKLSVSKSPYQEAVQLGLRSPHEPGLMSHVHLAFLRLTARHMHFNEVCDRVLAWLEPEGKPALQTGASAAITAILAPWTSEDPSSDRKAYLTHRLVEMYGDPRLSHGAPWSEVGTNERAVLFRWLTGENLRLFFDAITATNDSHMWAPRRKFYMDLYDAGVINAAWVAFAPEGARKAREILHQSGHRSRGVFGRQTSGGSRANTSILVAATTSGKIIVDGTHNYKVHVFSKADNNAPKLYQERYECEKIRLNARSDQAKPHNGDWTNWVKSKI